MDTKNYSDASTVARSVQKQRPKEAIGYQFEGDIAAAQKKFDAAADAYRAGLKQAASPDLTIKLHAVLKGNGKGAEAEKLASGWLRDNPKDPAVRMYLAQDALFTKDMAGAEKLYQSVVLIQPNNAIAYNNLAWVTGQLKKDGAVAYAEKALSLVPDQPAYMDTLAMLLMEKNDFAKALEWQNKAVGLQPANSAYRLNLARILVKNGNKDLARKELDELAKLGDKFNGQAQVAELRKSL
jgi:cellulose synthase operon protein C